MGRIAGLCSVRPVAARLGIRGFLADFYAPCKATQVVAPNILHLSLVEIVQQHHHSAALEHTVELNEAA